MLGRGDRGELWGLGCGECSELRACAHVEEADDHGDGEREAELLLRGDATGVGTSRVSCFVFFARGLCPLAELNSGLCVPRRGDTDGTCRVLSWWVGLAPLRAEFWALGRGDRGELRALGCGECSELRACADFEEADERGERVLTLLKPSSSLASAHAA